jgi:hypothetical protein
VPPLTLIAPLLLNAEPAYMKKVPVVACIVPELFNVPYKYIELEATFALINPWFTNTSPAVEFPRYPFPLMVTPEPNVTVVGDPLVPLEYIRFVV